MATGAFSELSALLWQEQALLERLLFKLDQEYLVLISGYTHWLAAVDEEIRLTLEAIKNHEVLRAVETAFLVSRVGLAPEATLGTIAASAPPPWSVILADQWAAAGSLVSQIEQALTTNRALLVAGERGSRPPGGTSSECRSA